MKLFGTLLTAIVFFPIIILADTKMEIYHLLGFVKKSTCKCEQNGILYSCKDAKGHILMKYKYFKKRGKIHSAEDFIRYSASKSELGGEKYRAHCSGKVINSSEWLLQELASYRKKHS